MEWPLLDVESGAAEYVATFECERGELGDVARRPKPQDMRSAPLGKGIKPIQDHVEAECVVGDRLDECMRGGGPSIVDLSEEVDGEMERFGSRPTDSGNSITKVTLEPLRRPEAWLLERHGQEAPHAAGAVAVGLGVGLAAVELGLGAHGLPPALVSDTTIWFAAQS
jgi:hypothetical protein